MVGITYVDTPWWMFQLHNRHHNSIEMWIWTPTHIHRHAGVSSLSCVVFIILPWWGHGRGGLPLCVGVTVYNVHWQRHTHTHSTPLNPLRRRSKALWESQHDQWQGCCRDNYQQAASSSCLTEEEKKNYPESRNSSAERFIHSFIHHLFILVRITRFLDRSRFFGNIHTNTLRLASLTVMWLVDGAHFAGCHLVGTIVQHLQKTNAAHCVWWVEKTGRSRQTLYKVLEKKHMWKCDYDQSRVINNINII